MKVYYFSYVAPPLEDDEENFPVHSKKYGSRFLILKSDNINNAFELAQHEIKNFKNYTGNVSDYKLKFVGAKKK